MPTSSSTRSSAMASKGRPRESPARLPSSLQAARPTLALDVPTGVNATTGEVSTPAIRACTTLMLDLPKRGVLELGARHHTGELFLADIGIPRSVHERLGVSIPGVFSEGPIVRLRR
ncbi:NAD(P)H-hydrate epimerase [Candidatus Amarobacter glycogenicus]|uniref:NAD(P)H-hydrate epimerase n=1 Tax=Candidatus Amarobacter glycogenicus TaxID=3140699 RepID=UPI0031CCADBE